MTIALSSDIQDQIQLLIESGQYPDADSVIQNALQALEQQVLEHARFLKTREQVLAGFASGGGRELTPELMDEIERRVEERFRRGDKSSPHARA